MRSDVRTRFWVETTLSWVAAGLFVLTLIRRDWIEILFGLKVDQGDGSLEILLALATAVVAVVAGLLARREWNRCRIAV